MDNESSLDVKIEERVNDLLSRMTLEEKIGQLKAIRVSIRDFLSEIFSELPEDKRVTIQNAIFSALREDRETLDYLLTSQIKKRWREVLENEKCRVGMLTLTLRNFSPKESAKLANEVQKFMIENSRLSIPIMIHDECLHGCMAKGSTIFPQSIALASTWDPELVEKVAVAIGKETRARGIHQCLSPTINIARDPRCGRTEETYGEDPYLASVMAVAFIRGVQSQKVVCTPKHFVANFVGDGGRDSYPIHFSERILREVYLPAFKAAVEKANALSIMAAYNSLDGVPCSCNNWLLTDLLKKEWGFRGFVVSDYSSVLHIMTKHGVAGTKAEAAKKAIEAGLDMELPVADCFNELLTLVKRGELSESVIDESVRRVLRVKFWLGLFDDPYVDPDYAGKICNCEEHRRLALEAARKSIVLLKNDGTLPLRKDLRAVAVIGPNASVMRLGGYSGYGVKVISPLEGIKNKVSPKTRVYFAEGCTVNGLSKEGFEEAKNAARKADVAILFVGNSKETEGESRDRCNLDLPGVQEELIKAICETGKPVVVVLINGSAVTMTNWIDGVNAVVEAWYPGEEGGNAIADVLFGDYNPGGKLPITFPRFTGQLPLYYNHSPTGRVDDYVDLRGRQPLFPFGHGLSYTRFDYSNLRIIPNKIHAGETVNVYVDVKNIGEIEGDEVVQLYIHKQVSSVSRPVKELKAFKRITLKPGEVKTVNLKLGKEELAAYDSEMRFTVEPGIYEIMIGSSSEDIRLKGELQVI